MFSQATRTLAELIKNIERLNVVRPATGGLSQTCVGSNGSPGKRKCCCKIKAGLHSGPRR